MLLFGERDWIIDEFVQFRTLRLKYENLKVITFVDVSCRCRGLTQFRTKLLFFLWEMKYGKRKQNVWIFWILYDQQKNIHISAVCRLLRPEKMHLQGQLAQPPITYSNPHATSQTQNLQNSNPQMLRHPPHKPKAFFWRRLDLLIKFDSI